VPVVTDLGAGTFAACNVVIQRAVRQPQLLCCLSSGEVLHSRPSGQDSSQIVQENGFTDNECRRYYRITRRVALTNRMQRARSHKSGGN